MIEVTSETTGVDVWQLAGLPGRLLPASYLTADAAAPQYRLIVDVLLDHQQHELTGVGTDELFELLRRRLIAESDATTADRLLETFDLTARMRQLKAWEVVIAWDDRTLRPHDFIANATRYQLTAVAAQIHRAVQQLGVDEVASLAATLAPPVLASQLDILTSGLHDDPQRAAEAWSVIRSTLDGMARTARTWQVTLAEAMAGAPDPDKVARLTEALQLYMSTWGAGVDTHSEGIATKAYALGSLPDAGWRPVVMVSLGPDASDQRVDATIAGYRATMDTLVAWFAGPFSQARNLRLQMRNAIAPMVRGRRTLAAVGGHVSRRAELLSLASRLGRCPDDDAAWRLWCTTTGLFAASHWTVPAPEPAGPAAAQSFWATDPVPVAVRLRTHGNRALTGAPARIPDRRLARRQASERAIQERAREAEVITGLLRRSGTPLSTWDPLTAAELDVLLMLLTAVAAASPSGLGPHRAGPLEFDTTHRDAFAPNVGVHTVDAETGDSSWRVRAEFAQLDAPPAVVRVETGRLVLPDLRLTVLRSPLGARGDAA